MQCGNSLQTAPYKIQGNVIQCFYLWLIKTCRRCQGTFRGAMPCDPTEEYRVFVKKSRKLIRWDIRSVMTTARFFRSLYFPINAWRTTLAVVHKLLCHFVDYFLSLRAEFLNWNTMYDLSQSIKINWPLVFPAQGVLKYLCLEHPKYLSICWQAMHTTSVLFKSSCTGRFFDFCSMAMSMLQYQSACPHRGCLSLW